MQDTDEKSSKLEILQRNLKIKIFEITKILLNSCLPINPILFYALYFIQMLQILWFSIHPSLAFLSQPLLLQQFQIGLQYLNFQGPLRNNNNLLPIFIISSFCFIIVHIVSIIISFQDSQKANNNKKSELKKIINRVTVIQIILLNTILTIPIVNISVITLYCDIQSAYYANSSIQCYSETHIIYCFFACINLLVILIQTFYYWFIFYIKNPFSTNYYATPNNLHRLVKFAIKIVFPLYFLIDSSQQFQHIFIFLGLSVLVFNLFFIRLFELTAFSQRNFLIQFFFENVLIWVNTNNIINYYLKMGLSNNLAFIQALLCSLLFAFGVQELYRFNTQKFLIENLTKTLKKASMVKFLNLIIGILFHSQQVLRINPIVCLLECSHKIGYDKSQELEQTIESQNLNKKDSKKTLINFMISFIEKLKEENSATEIKIIWINLLYDRGSKIIAFHEIGEINKQKLSIAEDFMIFEFKSTRAIHSSAKFGYNSDQSLSKVQKYLEFTQIMNQFENQIQRCTKINLEYWEQLCEQVPSLGKVKNLAFNSYKKLRTIQKLFLDIQNIYPENSTSMYLYNVFLNDVGINLKEKKRLEKKISTFLQRHSNEAQKNYKNVSINFKPNENMCVMNVSTTQNNIGSVLSCNTQVKRFLGYDSFEIIGQKVTKIMPKVYVDIHDDFIRGYLAKADEMRLPVQKTVYALRKDMKIIETNLAVKIFPSITSNFQLIGFFKERQSEKKNADLMVNLENFDIVGVSQGFLDFINNSFKLAELTKDCIKLHQLFPDLNCSKQFMVEQQIETIFKFSDCTDKLIQIDDASESNMISGQEVTIYFKSINYYPSVTIAIIRIIKKEEADVSLKEIPDNIMDETVKMDKKYSYVKERKKQYTTKISSQNMLLTNEQNQSMMIQRKIEDFLENTAYKIHISWIKIIFLITMLIIIGVNIFVEVNLHQFSYDNNKMLQQIELTQKIIQQQGLILFLTTRIFETSDQSGLWDKNIMRYKESLNLFQNASLSLFQKSSMRLEQDLIINEQQKYTLSIGMTPQNTIIIEETAYFDALMQIFYLGSQISLKTIDYFVSPLKKSAQSAKYFIQTNCEQIMPTIGLDILYKYQTALQKLSNKFIQQNYLFVIGKSLIFIFIFVTLAFIIWKINKFNETTVTIYNMMLKWDAYQLESKCRRFLVSSLDNANYEKKEELRHSELLRVIPKNFFSEIAKMKIIHNFGNINAKKKSNFMTENIQMQNSSSGDIKASQIIDKVQSSVKLQQDQQESLITSHEKIKLKTDFSNKFSLFFAFFILLIFIGMESLLLLEQIQMTQQVNKAKQQYIFLGKYTKNAIYSFYFGYSNLKSSEQEGLRFKEFFNLELTSFYTQSTEIDGIFSHQQLYSRNIYIAIENLNSLLKKPNLSFITSESEFLYIEDKILQNLKKIQDLRSQKIKEEQKIQSQKSQLIIIIKIVMQIFMIFLFFMFVYRALLNSLSTQVEKSVCMIKIIPIWLISKNKKIKSIILMKNSSKKKQEKILNRSNLNEEKKNLLSIDN